MLKEIIANHDYMKRRLQYGAKNQGRSYQTKSYPRTVYIENDIMMLNKAVNIDSAGNAHSEFEPFEILEIKNNINIISSPKGEVRSLPITRIVGRYTKLYGIIYIVKMKGFDLISMDDHEAIDYCMKFFDKTIPIERLGLPAIDYDDKDNNTPSSGHVEITFDEW